MPLLLCIGYRRFKLFMSMCMIQRGEFYNYQRVSCNNVRNASHYIFPVLKLHCLYIKYEWMPHA